MAMDPRPGGSRKPGPEAGDLMGVGLQFAASILLFFFLGRWADDRLGTGPWLLVLGVFVGLAGGFWSMYRRLVVDPAQRANDRDQGTP